MKKLLIIIPLILLWSCDTHPAPVLNSTNPFIVEEIYDIGNGMAEYYGKTNSGYHYNQRLNSPLIVLPAKWYNIGDTVEITK